MSWQWFVDRFVPHVKRPLTTYLLEMKFDPDMCWVLLVVFRIGPQSSAALRTEDNSSAKTIATSMIAPGVPVHAVASSPDGNWLAVAGAAAYILLLPADSK